MNIKMLVATNVFMSVALLGAQAAIAQPVMPAGPEGAAPAEAAPAAPAAPAANPQIVAFVDYQFPAADADKNGTLTAAEFTTWVGGLKAAEMQKAGQAPDAAAVKTYADSALATADKDKDAVLSKDELVKFFGG